MPSAKREVWGDAIIIQFNAEDVEQVLSIGIIVTIL